MTFFIGLDLGQVNDFSALCIDDYSPTLNAIKRPGLNAIRHLERIPLGTSYPAIVDRTITIRDKLMLQDRTQNVILVMDATGVGRPVVDLFWEKGLTPYAITITGKGSAHSDADERIDEMKKHGALYYEPSLRERISWNVPKRDLIGVLTIGLQQETLKISNQIPARAIFIEELRNFREKINIKTGHESFEAWREGAHDDLVLAAAIVVYVASKLGTPHPQEASRYMGGSRAPEVWGGKKQVRIFSSNRHPGGFRGGDLPGLM